MNPLDRQKLAVIHKMRSNSALRDWRGQLTLEFVEDSFTKRCRIG